MEEMIGNPAGFIDMPVVMCKLEVKNATKKVLQILLKMKLIRREHIDPDIPMKV